MQDKMRSSNHEGLFLVHSLSVLPSADVKHCSVENVHQTKSLLWVQAPLKQRHSGRVLLQTPEHNTAQD